MSLSTVGGARARFCFRLRSENQTSATMTRRPAMVAPTPTPATAPVLNEEDDVLWETASAAVVVTDEVVDELLVEADEDAVEVGMKSTMVAVDCKSRLGAGAWKVWLNVVEHARLSASQQAHSLLLELYFKPVW